MFKKKRIVNKNEEEIDIYLPKNSDNPFHVLGYLRERNLKKLRTSIVNLYFDYVEDLHNWVTGYRNRIYSKYVYQNKNSDDLPSPLDILNKELFSLGYSIIDWNQDENLRNLLRINIDYNDIDNSLY